MVSVVIVNWNTRDLLDACLRSLEDHPAAVGQEVIVVDNASEDGSAARVRERHPGVRLIEPGRNAGYAAGNNLGFAAAAGDPILALNPDTELPAGALDAAIAALAAHSEAGAVAGRLVGPDGVTQASVRGFPDVVGVLGDALGLARLSPGSRWDRYRMHGFDYRREQWAPQPMGTFLLFRRAALAAVGDPRAPFDEAFPIFFNEVDLLQRMARSGWRCWYDPAVVVRHLGGASTRQVRPRMIWESHRSLVRYWAKHPPSATARFALPVLAALLYAAAFVRARGTISRGFHA